MQKKLFSITLALCFFSLHMDAMEWSFSDKEITCFAANLRNKATYRQDYKGYAPGSKEFKKGYDSFQANLAIKEVLRPSCNGPFSLYNPSPELKSLLAHLMTLTKTAEEEREAKERCLVAANAGMDLLTKTWEKQLSLTTFTPSQLQEDSEEAALAVAVKSLSISSPTSSPDSFFGDVSHTS